MRDYKDCGFTFILPEATKFDDKLVVETNFRKKSGIIHKYVIYKAELVDKLQNHLETIVDVPYQNALVGVPIKIELLYGKRKVLVRDSILSVVCLSSSGEKTIVKFQFEDSENAKLVDVSNEVMWEDEQKHFIEVLSKVVFTEAKNENEKESHHYSPAHSVSFVPCDIPGLDRYRTALAEEKRFLQSEGGRKYKVTNGKRLGNSDGIYSYIFDLETELYISDDSPITLHVGIERVNGSVLMCEDFQIIILIEKNIGEKIGSAQISVEPWKLLEALEDRLQMRISLNGGIAQKLLSDGPGLSTTEPIEQIVKGQDAVIGRALVEPVTIVWGPPGTGKTQTMAELAIKYVEKGMSVLIVSHSNVSVDGVAERIYKLLCEYGKQYIYENGNVLRYGYIRNEKLSNNQYISSFRYALSKSPALEAQLNKLLEEYNKLCHTSGLGSTRMLDIHKQIGKIRSQVREEEQTCVGKASVLATTISKISIDKLFAERKFDVVMFDEISMAYVLQVVCAATFAKKHLVCVGDFNQLAPIAQSKASKVLCEDLFTYLKINVDGKPYYHPWLVMLDEQRRMHPTISAFASKYIYYNLLKDHASVSATESIANTEPFEGSPINYIDLLGCYCAASKNQDNSRFNILSAVFAVCTAIYAEPQVKSVSVIAPYAAQTRLIRAMIQDYKERKETQVRCATVHQFQGSESDVIIFDSVESYPGEQVGFLMGKEMHSVRRLINVALTRARGKFIAIGNTRFWENAFKEKKHTLLQLQQYILGKGLHISHKEKAFDVLVEKINLYPTIQLFSSLDKCMEQYCQDFRKAKEKIVISLPSAKMDEKTVVELKKMIVDAKKRGVSVLIKASEFKELSKELQEFAWGADNAIFPVVMIDDKITWYGLPHADTMLKAKKDISFKTVCQLYIRIQGKYTAEMIKSLSDLEYRDTVNGLIPLTEKDRNILAVENDEGNGSFGLAAYIEETMSCTKCKKSLRMTRGKSGKTILWCRECKAPQLLSPQSVERYIDEYDVRCPQCSADMSAGLGKMGVYARCENGHFIKLENI